MDIKRLIVKNKKIVIALTALVPVLQIIIALARFKDGFVEPSAILLILSGLLFFAVGGFVSAIILLYYLENLSTKNAKSVVVAGYVLTYPLMLGIGIIYGLLVGPLAPILGAVVQGILLGAFYLIGMLMDKRAA